MWRLIFFSTQSFTKLKHPNHPTPPAFLRNAVVHSSWFPNQSDLRCCFRKGQSDFQSVRRREQPSHLLRHIPFFSSRSRKSDLPGLQERCRFTSKPEMIRR